MENAKVVLTIFVEYVLTTLDAKNANLDTIYEMLIIHVEIVKNSIV